MTVAGPTAGSRPSAPTRAAARVARRRRYPWWLRQATLRRALDLAVCIPILVVVVRAALAGWYPHTDDAYIGMSALDVVRGHWPVMGAHSSSVVGSGVEVHHLGPLYAYALAPVLWLLDGRSEGLIIGQGLIASVAAVLTLHCARRIAGWPLAVATAAGLLATALGYGVDIWYRSFNPYPAMVCLPLLAYALTLVLAGRLTYLPVVAVVGSLLAQAHLSATPILAAWVGGAAVIGYLLWWWRRRRPWPLRGWHRASAPVQRRAAWATVALLGLCWLPVVVELVRFAPHNNAQQMLAFLSASHEPGVGIVTGLRIGLAHLSPRGLVTDVVGQELGGGAPFDVAAGAVLLGALVVLTVLRVRRRQAAARRLDILTVVLVVGFLAHVAASGRLTPTALLPRWEVILFWPLATSIWAVLVTDGWGLLAPRVKKRIPADRRARTALAALLVVPAAVLAAVSPLGGFALDSSAAIRASVVQIERAVDAAAVADGRQPLAPVLVLGDTMGAGQGVGWGYAYGLYADGYATHITAFGQLPEDWDFRKYTTSPPDAVRLVLLQDGDPADWQVRSGWRDPVLTLTSTDGRPVRVFVSPPP